MGRVHKPARHLLQLARHGGGVGGDRGSGRELGHKAALHRLVRPPVVQRRGQLDHMQRRQLVRVLTRLQNERRGLDARHHQRQRPGGRLPLTVVTVDAMEVLLQERALGPAQQRLVDDLALPEYVLQAVAGEAARQPPTDPHGAQHLLQRLEPLARGVLQPRQFVEHHTVELQRLLGQPLQVVVGGHHDLDVRLQRTGARRGGANRD